MVVLLVLDGDIVVWEDILVTAEDILAVHSAEDNLAADSAEDILAENSTAEDILAVHSVEDNLAVDSAEDILAVYSAEDNQVEDNFAVEGILANSDQTHHRAWILAFGRNAVVAVGAELVLAVVAYYQH